MTLRSTKLFVLASMLLGCAQATHAVIVLGPRQVITAADYLAGGRAQYQGIFGNYMGTPIAPRYFVTANHIGNNGGGFFNYHNGTSTLTTYRVTFAGRQDDLAIWKLDDDQPSFTLWAPLYNRQSEPGLPLTAVGRGTDKGPELINESGQQCGWYWGAADTVASFGTNDIDGVLSIAPPGDPAGFGGDLLYFTFSNPVGTAVPTECSISAGDSGGGVFVVDPVDGVQKLAGIISLTDGGLSLHAGTPAINAAIFDARGLYYKSHQLHSFAQIQLSSYATRISSRQEFIRSIAGVPPLPCPADFTGDRVVNTFDLAILLRNFGELVFPSTNGDVNEDGVVDTFDLAALLSKFGTPCP